MSWGTIFYRCPNCGEEWDDEWSCAVNSDCPECGARDIEPYDHDIVDDDEDEPDEPPPKFLVYTAAYCGMRLDHGQFESLGEAQERVKRRIEWCVTQGCEVVPLGDGPNGALNATSWEICEPEVCHMVPDWCGTLHIKQV